MKNVLLNTVDSIGNDQVSNTHHPTSYPTQPDKTLETDKFQLVFGQVDRPD
jgi:hypothetical protein